MASEDVRTAPDSGRRPGDLLDDEPKTLEPEFAESIGVVVGGVTEDEIERVPDWRWLALAAGYIVISIACVREAYMLVRDYRRGKNGTGNS